MNWKEQIEAQIAFLESAGMNCDWAKALLDAAVAADDYMTYGPLNADFGGDIAHNRLSHALYKLRETGNEEG